MRLYQYFTVFLDFFGRYLNNITQFEAAGFLFLFVECKADDRSDFFSSFLILCGIIR